MLKDYFEKEFVIAHPIDDVLTLKTHLIEQNPRAKDILDISRFAVNNDFVELNQSLKQNDNISIMPPSSGG
jgi:molybdopterin synthase sulfur carrier subunit